MRMRPFSGSRTQCPRPNVSVTPGDDVDGSEALAAGSAYMMTRESILDRAR